MRNIKMTNGSISQLCPETNVNKLEELVKNGFVPERDANGNIVLVDLNVTIRSDYESTQSILNEINAPKEVEVSVKGVKGKTANAVE